MSEEDKTQQTFDDSLLPEWAIHKKGEEELSIFFEEPSDRGEAEFAFAIPRGEVGQKVVSGSTSVVESEPELAPDPVTEPETTTEPEPQCELESEAEPVSEVEPTAVPEPDPETTEKAGEEQPSPAPRRADFAKFRCIYESHDGQLALYEDEYGHLTAVNTNRFA